MDRRRTWLGSAVLAAACAGATSCGGAGETNGGSESTPGSTSGDNTGGGVNTGSTGGSTGDSNTGGSTTGGSDTGGTGGSDTSGTNTGGSDIGGAGDNPIIDLRADVNRNGVVDLADPTEDAGEDVWTVDHGAIFLANIDDDQESCPVANQSDAQLAACNDAADSVINGPDDLEDLARLKTVPWPAAPADASATITVSAPGATYVRLFKKVGASFTVFNPQSSTLTAAELAAGVELAIEGKDILRDSAIWNGKVKITLDVDSGTGPNGALPDGSDTVELRISPVMFRHHLDEVQTVYVSKINSASSVAFRTDLLAAAQASGVPDPMVEISVPDQWNQDYFETAYMAMPAAGGEQKVIHVNFRSANYTNDNGLRSAGKAVYTVLRGKDVAGATVYDPAHANAMDSLNSFGNLETIPPYTRNGTTFTVGKVLRGGTPTFYPDKTFDKMITAQAVQGILYIDTSWLLVGHVDETTSFIKAATPRGWALLAADPTLAKTMLQQAKQQGFGGTKMFVGKFWPNDVPAQVSINQVLADPDVMNESAWAAVKIDNQVIALKAETGLTSAEIVKVAGLFEQASGHSVAYQPGMVNGIYLSDTDFGAPDPHGPKIDGQDIFKAHLTSALAPYGITTRWIEDWDLYHRLDGEVHCGSNTTRAVPTDVTWWESGL